MCDLDIRLRRELARGLVDPAADGRERLRGAAQFQRIGADTRDVASQHRIGSAKMPQRGPDVVRETIGTLPAGTLGHGHGASVTRCVTTLRIARPRAMQPSMSISDKELEEKLKAIQFWGDKKNMSIEDLVMVQPGLARIMPEIGIRTWKLYYAAKAGNWTRQR